MKAPGAWETGVGFLPGLQPADPSTLMLGVSPAAMVSVGTAGRQRQPRSAGGVLRAGSLAVLFNFRRPGLTAGVHLMFDDRVNECDVEEGSSTQVWTWEGSDLAQSPYLGDMDLSCPLGS